MFAKAVIDSGPLFDALVLNFDLRRSGYGQAPKFKVKYASILDEGLQDSTAQRQFLVQLSSIREKLTTAHVIAELYGLEKKRLGLYGLDLHVFWQSSIELLVDWGIDEQLVRLLDLAKHQSLQTCLPRIGVTDTGLIDLAVRHGCVLITRDAGTLAIEAFARQVDCRLVNQLFPLM